MTPSLAQLEFPHAARQLRRYASPMTNLRNLWHRGSAWLVGPLLVGLMAVGLAKGGDYASQGNRLLIGLHPLAPLLFMPAAFALLAYIGRRFFPGSQGSGI